MPTSDGPPLFELVLLVRQPDVDAVSDALMQGPALSVSVEDADALTDAEDALFGEPGMPPPRSGWLRSTVRALFTHEQQATDTATLLLAQDWARQVHVQAIAAVPQADWVRLTQAQFDPVPVAPGFWVVPSWHEAPADATHVIQLDPGMAFGTGTHPTTRMCLAWIAAHADALRGQAVLDYGCGSGILAIGAALHGAGPVDAVDIDPAAIQATRDNAAANGVAVRAGLPDVIGQAQHGYAVVLANILAAPLKLLAPMLCGHVRTGGRLVLAGILARQAEELRAAYAPWCELQVTREMDGWILMTATVDAPRARVVA